MSSLADAWLESHTSRRSLGARPRLLGASQVSRRKALQVRAASISSNDFRPGVYREVDGAPDRILGAQGGGECVTTPPVPDPSPRPPAQSTCT